jgi:hypothetical protein
VQAGIRNNDEGVIIASHTTEDVAEKVVKLIHGGEFKDNLCHPVVARG